MQETLRRAAAVSGWVLVWSAASCGRGAPEVAAKESPVGTPETEAPRESGFLAPPANESSSELESAPPGGALEERVEPSSEIPEAQPAELAELPPEPVDPQPVRNRVGSFSGDAELELAGAMLHLPWHEFENEIARAERNLAKARLDLMFAFSLAMGGELSRAQAMADELEEASEVGERERMLLRAALGDSGPEAVPAELASESSVTRAMRLALIERDAEAYLANGELESAAVLFSDLLRGDVDSRWAAHRATLQDWSDKLHLAQRGHRWNARGNWPSVSVTVRSNDSLVAIRKRVIQEHAGLNICTGLLERANQMSHERDLHPDDVLRVPTERVHVLVDLSTRWILYFHGDEVVAAWEGGIGRPGNETQVGEFVVGVKQKEPMWFRPGHEPIPYGDPENLLGTRWLAWYLPDGKDTNLGFHGTSDPDGVGERVSAGCVRMRNEAVEELYEILPIGAAVQVRP